MFRKYFEICFYQCFFPLSLLSICFDWMEFSWVSVFFLSFFMFHDISDIRSNDRNLWCQVCKGWSYCLYIWQTGAKTGCWKLDPGIYYGHLSLDNISRYLKVNSKNLGILFPSSSNVSLASSGFIFSWLRFLGFDSWNLPVSYKHAYEDQTGRYASGLISLVIGSCRCLHDWFFHLQILEHCRFFPFVLFYQVLSLSCGKSILFPAVFILWFPDHPRNYFQETILPNS